ncbi:MAG TPA: SRPBCC family protein, partial [Planctomycetia bacterium]|nr:SRPBCC family protein [Planctomycetia bacterium]
LGTKFKETRKIFGREATETMEFTRFDPGRAYALSCESCGCEYRSDFEFRPDGEGTEIAFTMNVITKSFFAKLMSPLAKLMAGPMKKCVEADLDSLAKRCEAVAATPS